jgi:hypothetical protein
MSEIRDAAYYVERTHKDTIENIEQMLESGDPKSKETLAKIRAMLNAPESELEAADRKYWEAEFKSVKLYLDKFHPLKAGEWSQAYIEDCLTHKKTDAANYTLILAAAKTVGML